MKEADCYLVELAYSMGFISNDDADGVTCTDEQLVAFARRIIEHTERRVREEKT